MRAWAAQGRAAFLSQSCAIFETSLPFPCRGENRPWRGACHLVAIYDRAFTPLEVVRYHYLSLGKNGSVTVEFTDNFLVDVEGPDLWVFEIGPFVESTRIAISKDGETWIEAGVVEGSTSGIDIGPFVEPGDKFSFVRITDDDNSAGQHAGADIDAVGAIGSIKRDESKEGAMEKTPAVPGEDGCFNLLRIEMKDGTVQVIDLSKVKSIVPITGN